MGLHCWEAAPWPLPPKLIARSRSASAPVNHADFLVVGSISGGRLRAFRPDRQWVADFGPKPIAEAVNRPESLAELEDP